jgi:hypothetical protein
MTTLDDVLAQQKGKNLLAPPSVRPAAEVTAGSITFNLYNSTSSNTVNAYVTGLAINNNSATYLLQSDGVTPCMCSENATLSFNMNELLLIS